MKKYLFLVLLIIPNLIKAQDLSIKAEPISLSNKSLFNLVGLSISAGAYNFNLQEINNSLNKIGAPTLSAEAGAKEIRLDLGNEILIGGVYLNQIDISQTGTTDFKNSQFNYSRLNGYYLGFDLSRTLLNKKKWQINFPSVGVAYSFFNLKLDSLSKNPSVSIYNLGTTRIQSINLSSNQNLNIKAGAELFYKTGWLKKHLYDFRFGVRTGYNYPLKNNGWQLTNTATGIPDLPVIDKGSYYLMVQIIGVMLELADKNN